MGVGPHEEEAEEDEEETKEDVQEVKEEPLPPSSELPQQLQLFFELRGPAGQREAKRVAIVGGGPRNGAKGPTTAGPRPGRHSYGRSSGSGGDTSGWRAAGSSRWQSSPPWRSQGWQSSGGSNWQTSHNTGSYNTGGAGNYNTSWSGGNDNTGGTWNNDGVGDGDTAAGSGGTTPTWNAWGEGQSRGARYRRRQREARAAEGGGDDDEYVEVAVDEAPSGDQEPVAVPVAAAPAVAVEAAPTRPPSVPWLEQLLCCSC